MVGKSPASIGGGRGQRDREALAEEVDPGAGARVACTPDCLAFRPAGGDIDGDGRGQVEALGALPTMTDEIGLEAPGVGRAPFAVDRGRNAGTARVQRTLQFR